MIVAPETGPLEHFDRIGFVIVGATLITLVLMHALTRAPTPQASSASSGGG